MDDTLSSLLDQRLKKNQEIISQKLQSVFLSGVLAGVFLSYTGTVGFITGIVTGLMIKYTSSEYSEQICYSIIDKVEALYTHFKNAGS